MRTFKTTVGTVGTGVQVYTPGPGGPPITAHAVTAQAKVGQTGNSYIGIKGIVGSTLTNVGVTLIPGQIVTLPPALRQIDQIWTDGDTIGNIVTFLVDE